MGMGHFNKWLSRSVGLFVLAGMSALSISCTRAPENNASIKLELPSSMLGKAGTLSSTPGTLYPGHVVINVTGPGISSPIFFSWDSDDGRNALPQHFDLTVPSGSNRLVQVLVLYRRVAMAGENFYYGDSTIAIQNDTSVTIKVSAIGGAMSESQIIGRYLDNVDNNQGPTAKIIMKYTPPNKPAMIVHTSEMFGGLFNLFALQGSSGMFDYVTPEGLSLFGGPAGIDSFPAGSLNNRLVRVAVPSHYRQRGGDGGVDTYEQTSVNYTVAGWFGTNSLLASKSVCYPSSPGAIRYAYTTASNSTPLQWNSSYVEGGGVSGSTDSENLCTASGSRFADYLSLDGYGLSGRDEAMAFQGPFLTKYTSGYRQALSVSYAANAVTLNWEYAPHVVTKASLAAVRRGVDGSDAYYRILPSGFTGDDRDYKDSGSDGILCGLLTSKDFKLLTSRAATESTPVESVTVSTGLPSDFGTAYSEGRLQIVLCPYQLGTSGKKYFSSAVEFRTYGGAPMASYLFVVAPGQTFADGDPGVGGSPIDAAQGANVNLLVYAAYYFGGQYFIDTTFNGVFTISGSGGATFPGTVAVANGIGNFDITAPGAPSSIYFSLTGPLSATSNSINVP